jgi:prepilin-type N-terminal cleavage/methylation domain-containing protein
MRSDKEKRENGFTLFELLVVMGLVSLVGSMVLGIFAYILKGAVKANILKKANDNGTYVIELISKEARNAQEIICSSNSLVITTSTGSSVNFSCEMVDSTGPLAIKKDGGAITEGDFSVVSCNVFNCSIPPRVVEIGFELAAWDKATGTMIEKGEGGFRVEFKNRITPRKY